MGCSFLFAVFDSHDHIHWGVEGVDTPTGDFRLKAVPGAHRAARRAAGLRLGPRPAVAAGGPALGALLPRGARADRRARRGPGLRIQGRLRARVVHRPGLRRARRGPPRPGVQPERDARRDASSSRELLADLDAQRPRDRPDPRRVRLVAARALARRQGSARGGRRSAARARDDSRRRARQRPALVLRAARHARRRRQRLALPPLDPQGRPQPAVGRRRRPRA